MEHSVMTNPMSGPAYATALKNAVEQNRTAYCTPPRTGGKQMSVRLDDFLLNHVETIADLAKWNRSEVLYAIAHCGLFHLYEEAPRIAEEVVARIVEKFKAQHAADFRGTKKGGG
jgi:hypothetical protein